MKKYNIRVMKEEDFTQVSSLWSRIQGLSIRSMDDSMEGILRFIRRNPNTSIVAEIEGTIVGTILCGHDGREATLYHVCVQKEFRELGIGHQMVEASLTELRKEKVSKVKLVAFDHNEIGNQFWQHSGWSVRKDLNLFEYSLNEDNIVKVNE
ncbi:MAG: GNAT family N-acetyltransferase [Lachnospiraceae bacterium]